MDRFLGQNTEKYNLSIYLFAVEVILCVCVSELERILCLCVVVWGREPEFSACLDTAGVKKSDY